MAIISGMEAAKVDDVKPFEMPIEALATGVKGRQDRFDKVKDTNAKGAAELMFDIRDLKGDYEERQRVIDEYNKRVDALSESVGGDWSQLDNSQIQMEAVKSAQDPRVGHLKMAKKQADDYEKITKQIEADNGFSEKFGEDANTQSLYKEDGSLRDLTDWSVQKKLDHVKAAHDYYKDVGHNLREKFELIHSTNPEYANLNAEQKNQLWYDFWISKKSSLLNNHDQIDQIKNFLIQDYRATDAGKQYWNILYRDARNQGKNELEAQKVANDVTFETVQRIGASKYKEEYKIDGKLDPIMKPSEGSGGGGGGGTRNTTINQAPAGEVPKAWEISPGPGTPTSVTSEGAGIKTSTYKEAADEIMSEKFNNEGLDVNFSYENQTNVFAMADAAAFVPHSSSSSRGGIAKSLTGTYYSILDQNLDEGSKGRYGDNAAAARFREEKDYTWYLGRKGSAEGSRLYEQNLDEGITAFKEANEGKNENGRLSFSVIDVDKALYNKAEKISLSEKAYQDLKTQEEKNNYIAQKKSKLQASFRGTDGDISGMYQSTFDPQKGFPVITIKDEYEFIEEVIKQDLKTANDNIARGTNVSMNTKRRDYAQMRLEAFARKKQESEAAMVILNTEQHDAPDEMIKDPKAMAIIYGMEAFRSKSKSQVQIANQYQFLDNAALKASGMTEEEVKMYRNPELITDKELKSKIRKDIAGIQVARVTAATEAIYQKGSWNRFESINYAGTDIGLLNAQLTSSKTTTDEASTINNLINTISFVSTELVSNSFDPGALQNIHAEGVIPGLSTAAIYIARRAGIPEAEIRLIAIERKDPKNTTETSVRLGIRNALESSANLINSMYVINPKTGLPTPAGDHTAVKEHYGKNVSAEILKSNSSEKYKSYIALIDTSKKTWESESKNYLLTGDSKEAKEIRSEVEDNARLSAIQAMQSSATNKRLKIRRKLYNPDEPGMEENIDLSSEEQALILGAYNSQLAEGKAPMKSMGDIFNKEAIFMGLRADYYNDVSIGQDGGFTGTFVNGDFNMRLPDGKGGMMDVQVEVAVENLSVAAAVAMGMTANSIEYGQQTAAGLTKSNNTGYVLTSPPTKNTNNPKSVQFHLLPFPVVIAGKERKKGSVIELRNYDVNKPLYAQLESVGEGDYKVWNTIEEANRNFHEEHVKPYMKDLIYGDKKIEKMRTDYGNISNMDKRKALMLQYEGPDTWAAYEAAEFSFDKMKAQLVARHENAAFEADPKEVENSQYEGGNKLVSKTNPGAAVRLTNAKGQEVTFEDCKNMTPQELKHFYAEAQKLQKAAGKNHQLDEILTVLEKNITGEKSNILDGELYLLPVSSYKPVVATKKETTSKNRDGRYYELFNDSKGKQLAIAKNGASNLLKQEAAVGFQNFFELATAGIGKDLAAPFEISSTVRSINANAHTYRTDFADLTNSDHFRGTAIDVSTLGSGCKEGDQLFDWCNKNSGDKGVLAEAGIYVYRHAIKGGKDHLHIEFVGKGHPNAGSVILEVIKEEVKPTKK